MNKLKKIGVALFVGIAMLGGLWLITPSEAASCSDFNVVACGTPTHMDMRVAYTRPEIKSLYNQWDITDDMVTHGKNMRNGTVDANGNITVDGVVVATNAVTVQAKAGTRQPTPQRQYSAAGHTYYQYTTGQSFVEGKTVFTVFAWFDDYGKFISAVIKDCGNPVWGVATWKPKTIEVCDVTTNKIVKIKENEFDSKKHSKDMNDCKQIKVCDLASKQIITIKEKEFNSQKHSKDVNDCKEIQVCDLESSTIITIKEKEFDSNKHSKDLSDCEKMKVCELETGAIVTIKTKEFDDKKHSTKLEDCDKVKVCRISDKQIVEITRKESENSDYTTDMSKCADEPVTPPETPSTPAVPAELPKTGAGNIVTSVLGLGGLAAVTIAYVASRRQV